MIESQAQRTLVKSPPELWAELSDPTALARYLGEIGGEIRITRAEPERTVVWEGERASGRVELAPSGWGTKVILTLCHEPAPAAVETTQAGAPDAPGEPSAAAAEPRPEVQLALQRTGPATVQAPDATAPAAAHPSAAAPAAGSDSVARPAPESHSVGRPAPESPGQRPPDGAGADGLSLEDAGAETVAAEPQVTRPGFFARLFRRRTRGDGGAPDPQANAQAPATPAAPGSAQQRTAETLPAAASPPPEAPPTRARDTPSEPQARPPAADAEPVVDDPATRPERQPQPPDAGPVETPDAAGVDSEQATTTLTSMLDALGSAHHRPFSRG